MKDLQGRNAVVTGGGSGIGRGIALALSRQGMNVVVADIEGDTAGAVADEIKSAGGQAVGATVNVTEEESLAALQGTAQEAFGPTHVLSNNAGVLVPMEPMTSQTDADWQYVFSVNVFGIVKSVQAFLPGMRKLGEGHIVNTASMAGLIALPIMPIGIYTASKYACVGYTEMLRGELSGTGISASVLCPGMVKSNLTATSARNRPGAFGGPDDGPEGEAPPEIEARMMPAETVGEIVVRGIQSDRLHIITHPDTSQIEARFKGLMADFEAEA